MRLALVGLCAGCLSKPSVPLEPPDAPPDAFVPAACEGVPFEQAKLETFPELSGLVEAEPTISTDLLEVYFSKDVDPAPDGYNYDILRATRPQLTSSFTLDATPLPFNTTADEHDPALTADARMIIYVSGSRLQQSTRTGTTWSTPVPVPGLESIDAYSLDLSPDGLVVHFADDALPVSKLRRATRADRDAPFVLDPMPVGTDFHYFTVTSDGRELYWYSVDQIHRATLAGGMFVDAGPAFALGADPDLSSDNRVLVVGIASSLGVVRRDCP